MDLLRVAGATLNQIPLDFAGNRDRIVKLLEDARRHGVELLCLPELCITGYGCEDAFFSLAVAQQAEATLSEILPHTHGQTVLLGLPHYFQGALYNAAVLVQDGHILGVNAKRVLPREGVHYEPRWFRPWPFGKVVTTTLCGEQVALGDLRYQLGTLGVAVEICEEAWDSVPASAAHADAVQVVLNPSASHFALGKYAKREHLVANSSRSLQVFYVYSNLLGLEAGRLIYDGGVLFAAGGEIIKRGDRFGFHDGAVVWQDINPELASVDKLKSKPVRAAAGEDDSPTGSEALAVPVNQVKGRDPRHLGVTAAAKTTKVAANAPAAVVLERFDEFLQAQMLGLFDYHRKSGAKGFVLSLSGGCDSACCAVLVAHMLAASAAELGLAAAVQRFGMPLRNPVRSVGDWTSLALTCVYQKTAMSGPVTEAAAAAVASAVFATYHLADVQPMVDAYVRATELTLKRSLSWQDDDVALQNIQARTRAPLVWMLANVAGALLLTTSNRSEAAVGYATMDGDTAGGLAPLSGIDKPFLQAWLRWAETTCQSGLGPIAALGLVNAQQPTAELRPAAAKQRDEDDLMPYAVLERIERYMLRDRLGAADIQASLACDFPEESPDRLGAYIDKFHRLWAVSQWKRERYAPGFHVDELSLDPKTWCRYPILSRPMQLVKRP